MNREQVEILFILAATVGLFLWGKWRHDVVAIASLLACVIAGLIPANEAFGGFGHAAVITVACVLILSRMLQNSGAMDVLSHLLIPQNAGRATSIALLCGCAAFLSAFMNNVGALALLMPISIQTARRLQIAPGQILMPVAFASALGGMTTLIGTPPNLIVSGFRDSVSEGGGFVMFDFTPVGIGVVAAGMAFLCLLGWRLVPVRQRADEENFAISAYMAEAMITPNSPLAGKSLRANSELIARADVQIVGQVLGGVRVAAPDPAKPLNVGDLLVVEAEPEGLAAAVSLLGLELTPGSRHKQSAAVADEPTYHSSAEVVLVEVVARPGSDLVGRSVTEIELRKRFGINLLALSRHGERTVRRLRSERIRAGDVLLLQGAPEALSAFSSAFACVPLAPRPVRIPSRRLAVAASLIMAGAVAVSAFGILPSAVAFSAAALLAIILRMLPLRQLYESVDWSVIVLLGALIPVAGALSTTGTADVLARFLVTNFTGGNAVVALLLILIITMTLSDFMNNAATAAVMCPIAISTAEALSARPDSFLMAVAIGASCAFLTPIGHQNNTLILGPGGFRFGDYWRMGLPLEVIVIATAIPLLLIFWPL